MVICLELGADLHMAELMPLPLLSLASVKSRLVLPFWYRLTSVVPEKGPLNGCVCVCVCYFTIQIKFSWRLRSRLNRRHCLAVNGAVYLLQAAAENSVVFRWDLKEASEEADRRSGSREFHTGGQLC